MQITPMIKLDDRDILGFLQEMRLSPHGLLDAWLVLPACFGHVLFRQLSCWEKGLVQGQFNWLGTVQPLNTKH